MKQFAKVKNPNSNRAPSPFFKKEGPGEVNPDNQSVFFSKMNIQPKLEISEPGDRYEQEADQVADKVMTMPDPAIQMKERKEEDEPIQMKRREDDEDEPIQMKRISRSEKKEEEKPIQKEQISRKANSPESVGSYDLENRLHGNSGSGNPLPDAARKTMEHHFGSDFSKVRVHTHPEAVQMNNDLNARAFTHGSNIYFGNGYYDPGNSAGKHLLAHELTHVVQQSGIIKRKLIQRDLAMSLPIASGGFDINMIAQNGARATPATTRAGMNGSVRFLPATTAPYSNEIKLIQIVRLRSISGADISPRSLPTGYGPNLRTVENPEAGIQGGFFTDVLHQNFNNAGAITSTSAPGRGKSMAYEGGTPVYGFKRSNDPRDIKSAELQDTPGTNQNADFTFETVAKGEDTNTVYGSLHWGFGTRNGMVANETVNAADSQSATFDAAIRQHRDFYVHEPVILYFGFNSDVLTPEEASKIDTFLNYLTSFPDVEITLRGYADRRGSASYNESLTLRRIDSVFSALSQKGISAERIYTAFGVDDPRGTATEEFTSGDLAPNPGRSQDLEANRRGNRRVVITFEHSSIS